MDQWTLQLPQELQELYSWTIDEYASCVNTFTNIEVNPLYGCNVSQLGVHMIMNKIYLRIELCMH